MGEAVGRLADVVVLTTDNPRSERPEDIAAEAEVGLRAAGARGYHVVLDRRAAIAFAVSQAAPGDTVLIAGKGHETYQEVCGVRTDFDDRVEARAALASRWPPSGSDDPRRASGA
jgi:UDP-N-acetylmuramyl tripeptide synthase